MPGIVGVITKGSSEQAERDVVQMITSMKHEAFYSSGKWCDRALGVYVGWVTRTEAECANTLLRSETADVALVFAGEEFSASGPAADANERSRANGTPRPSYLVRQYNEDPSFPKGLNGRFQGLVIDQRSQTALLFNDRYGMQRVYYHEAPDAFYFAAEAKAILAVCPGLRELDAASLGEFVSCGCVLENRTVFQGIQVLPPASAWSFRNGAVERKRSYFDPREWEELPTLEPKAYYTQLRDVFSTVLPRYFGGKERIGMSLTGGLDSRMIVAWHKPAAGAVPCYSFGGMYGDCQDVRMARVVAKACGLPHQVIRVGQEFLSQFPQYAERSIYLTDACVDLARTADLYVNEHARRIAPVRMTGNYGGEVLRRVRAFKPVDGFAGIFDPAFASQVYAARESYNRIVETHPLSFAVFRQAPWHHYGLLTLEQTQLSVRSPYLDNHLVETVFRAPEADCRSNDACLRLIDDGQPSLSSIRTDRGLLANALTRNLLEFTFKADYAYDYGMPQWLARLDHVFSPLHLERLFLGRHKFYHYRIWYRDPLSGFVRDILLDNRALSRPYVKRKAVEEIVESHTKGYRNHTTAIHKLITLELLHRLFLDSRVVAREVPCTAVSN